MSSIPSEAVVTAFRSPGRAAAPSHWADGGLLQGWGVAYSRLAHPLGTGEQQARFMFTEVNRADTTSAVQAWVDHLDALGLGDTTTSSRMFWRLALRQRSVALSAQPLVGLGEAMDNARQLTRDAAALTVSFAFFIGEPIPRWVVSHGDVPVFIGLPQHHLVRVQDPRESLAALLGGAKVKAQVHVVGSSRAAGVR
jgi:hypothetical protein